MCGPLLRPPSRHAHKGLCKRGVTSSEITRLLRTCFGREVAENPEDGQQVSSHSLKATALSWTAKFGIHPADQAVLGRRASAACETSNVYSRDASIRAVGSMMEVIQAIAEGRFQPDASRSFYKVLPEETMSSQVTEEFVNVEHQPPAKAEIQDDLLPFADLTAQEPIDVMADSSEESSDSGASSSDDSSSPVPVRCAKRPKQQGVTSRFFKHKTSGCVHFLDPIMDSCASQVFTCGKRVTLNFMPTSDRSGMCRLCKVQAAKREAAQAF